MDFLKWLLSIIFSERGEGEGDDVSGSGGGSAEGDDGAQGDQETVAEGAQVKPVADVDALTRERDEWKGKHDTLTGQSRATERNLAMTREALKANGLQLVADSDGSMKVVPIVQSRQGTRFTDEHKNKFFSYFPDSKSGEDFLNLQALLIQDQLDNGFKAFRGQLSSEQSFFMQREASISRMNELFPSLNPKSAEFNKSFYDKADQILAEQYWDQRNNRPLIANADLIAANQAAIEMGIAPVAVAKAKADGFQQGKDSKKIVGTPQGSQSSGGGGGFRKLAFEEYSKLSPDDKEKYQREEVLARKGK